MTTTAMIPAEMSDEEALRHGASLIPHGMTFRNKDEMYRWLLLVTRKSNRGGPLPMSDRHQLWRVACRIWTQGSTVGV